MKRDEAMELARNGFEELSQALAQGKSDVLTKYLAVMARFHNYSFRNTLMILMQRPTATRVAGFRQWEKLGRNVKKGEKGIGIFAPMVYRNKDESNDAMSDDNTGGAKPGRTLRGFRVVHVFDLEQTDGEPLPELAGVDGEPGDWLSKLEVVVRNAGIELEYTASLGGAEGRSEGGKISVLADLPASEKFSVLAHEYGYLCGAFGYVAQVIQGCLGKARNEFPGPHNSAPSTVLNWGSAGTFTYKVPTSCTSSAEITPKLSRHLATVMWRPNIDKPLRWQLSRLQHHITKCAT